MNNKSTLRLVSVCLTLAIILSFGSTLPVMAASDQQAELNATIVVTGDIAFDTLWTANNVYYILNDISVDPGVTLTIQGGTIVKFWVPLDPSIVGADLTGLTVNGNLAFVPGPDPSKLAIFTSGRDDTLGGDTNGDADQTLPAPGDWDFLRFVNWTQPVSEHLEIHYSKDGLNFHNTTASNYAPVFSNNLLVSNTCGITLSLTGNGSVGGTISENTFTHNKYGFCTRRPLDTGSGKLDPALVNNIFSNNSILPVYLFGNSYPTYSGNTFEGYLEPGDRLGIGLGGDFTVSGGLTIVDNLPFVLVNTLEVEGAATNLTIPAGAVFKSFTSAEMPKPTDPPPSFKMSGNVTFQSTLAAPIIFTSYHDDTVGGDTNGDDNDSEGYAGDWGGVYFLDKNLEGALNYTFHDLVFKYAINGFTYEINQPSLRTPTFDRLTFDGNKNGLRLKAVFSNAISRITPFIQNSTFTNHGVIPSIKSETEPGVPIFLENVVQPAYLNNTFSGNLHPAIGIAGRWRSSASLVQVAGDGLSSLPFLIHGEVWFGDYNISGGIDSTVTLNIPAGSVIKFFYNRLELASRGRIRAAGKLALLSTPESPIVFTSYFDNVYGGDTSDTATLPAASDWWEVLVRHPETAVAHAIFRYGDQALHVENKHATTAFTAGITDSIFAFNNYGLYLDIQGNADITSEISGNEFDRNAVGLGTFAKNTLTTTPKVMGLSLPVIDDNLFTGNTLFPIYLNGSASLEFFQTSNVFIDNAHTAIALGGYFGAVKQDPAFNIILPRIMAGPNAPANTQLVPYVVWANTNFDWQTPTWMDGGLVFKFNTAISLNFYGKMSMNTALSAPNVFTSYKDDSVGGDTNGTPSPNPLPLRTDWKGLYIYNPQSSPFLYSTIRWSENGLVIYQHKDNPSPADITFRIAENSFTDNKNGLTFYIASDYDILSLVENNTFYFNDYGFHTFTEPSAIIPHGGTSNPTLKSNDFSVHAEFPIYLQGSADPTYDSNTFWDNIHPAIAVGGTWTRDATWTLVAELSGTHMPYVVKENLTLELYWYPILVPTIQLPADLVVKFVNDRNLYIFGYLDLLSAPTDEVIFTSYLDDAFKGDTNHDGAPVSISRTAWKSVWLADFPGKNNVIHDARFFYATAGIGLYYEGPENTQTATIIQDTIFSASHSAVAAVIGWRQVGTTIYGGKGNINATISNVQIIDSNYGLLTISHDKATGIINPVLENLTFTNIANYPIFMGGTTYPMSVSGLNQVLTAQQSPAGELSSPRVQLDSTTSAPGADATLQGLDHPAYQEALAAIPEGSASLNATSQATADLTVAPNLHPAIGMGGAWNNAGTLLQVEGVPYAITGNFPLTVTVSNYPTYKPANNVTIGTVSPEGAQVAVPAGTVFKVAKDLMLDVKGTLNLLSTNQSPVIFTSIKDDSIAGDTNEDGVTTRPAKGDWGEVRLAATNTFDNVVLRYATKGLHIYFEGGINLNNLSSVAHSSFINNINGISLTAKDNGDIFSTITESTFDQNTVHILGYPSDTGKTGNLCVDAHSNDLFGLKVSQNGIENNNLNGRTTALVDCPLIPFDATGNYWGDPSGPYHLVLNPAGLGSRVSDRVKFDPWLAAPVNPPALYTISGRITKDSPLGDGLAGVLVTLSGAVPGTTTQTDSQGYYSFSGLQNGNYLVSPGLAGYSFTPAYLNILLANADAEDSNFIATPNLELVGFSVNSVLTFRPIMVLPKTYCRFTVTIDQQAPASQSVKVNYATLDQTAVANTDFIAKSGILTFVGTTVSLPVDIELKQTPLLDPAKYFSLVLSNPIKGYILVPSGTCTIMTTNLLFAPFIRK